MLNRMLICERKTTMFVLFPVYYAEQDSDLFITQTISFELISQQDVVECLIG